MWKSIASVLLKFTFFILFFLCQKNSKAQSVAPKQYLHFIETADSLYQAKDFLHSAGYYSLAFEFLGWKGYPTDRYNAACSWALAGISDSAFSNLERITERAGYADLDQITNDIDLNSLHGDPRWTQLLSFIMENKNKIEMYLDKELIHLLDSLVSEDKKWRNYMTKYNNGKPVDDTLSEERFLNMMKMTDSLNYFPVQNIFKKYGFPNFAVAGEQGSTNFWLLVQHQDAHPEFQEEVLKTMKAAVDDQKASAADYAYLTDRVKVNTGQLQIYGTQMQLNPEGTSYEPKPIIDPEKLNERRAAVGLSTIEDYIQLMNTRHSGSIKTK